MLNLPKHLILGYNIYKVKINMEVILSILLGVLVVGALGLTAFLLFRKYKNYERTLDMVFLKVLIPQKESKEDRERESEQFSTGKDFKEVLGLMTHFFTSLHSVPGAVV